MTDIMLNITMFLAYGAIFGVWTISLVMMIMEIKEMLKGNKR